MSRSFLLAFLLVAVGFVETAFANPPHGTDEIADTQAAAERAAAFGQGRSLDDLNAGRSTSALQAEGAARERALSASEGNGSGVGEESKFLAVQSRNDILASRQKFESLIDGGTFGAPVQDQLRRCLINDYRYGPDKGTQTDGPTTTSVDSNGNEVGVLPVFVVEGGRTSDGGYTTSLEACYKHYEREFYSINAQMISAHNLINNPGVKTGVFKKASVANDVYKTSRATLTNVRLQCAKRMGDESGKRRGNVCSLACDPSKLTGSTQEETIRAQQLMGNMQTDCVSKYNVFVKSVEAEIANAHAFARSSGKTARHIKTGIIAGAAVVGGVMLYNNHSDNKKEKKKKKQIEADFQNGMLTKEDGEKVNCLTTSTYGTSECQPVLFNYCGKAENSDKAGCVAFNNKYCSAADASQSFCLANASKNYCASGALASQSPACQWMSSRPSECAKSPEQIQCLTALTPAYLTAECPKFPNDPLCQAHLAGKVVTQPAASGWTTASTASAGGSGLDSMVASNGSAAATGSTSSASTGTGSVVLSGNLWHSNSAAHQQLCATGQLANCK